MNRLQGHVARARAAAQRGARRASPMVAHAMYRHVLRAPFLLTSGESVIEHFETRAPRRRIGSGGPRRRRGPWAGPAADAQNRRSSQSMPLANKCHLARI